MSSTEAARNRVDVAMEMLEQRRLFAVNLGTNFRGMIFSDTDGFTPPDPILAVGPSHIVELVNTNIAIYNKSTKALISEQRLQDFFAAQNPGNIMSDPQIAYDEYSGRFVIAIVDLNQSTNASAIDFAVSNSSDPTQGFTEKRKISTKETTAFLPGNQGKSFFSDYPRMGFNQEVYTLTFNMFTFPIANTSAYDHVQVLTIKKSDAIDANNATFSSARADRTGASNSTMTPAAMHGVGPGAAMWFVEETLGGSGLPSGSSIRVVRMTNLLSATPTFVDADVTVPGYVSAATTPPATQPSGATIETNDSRILNVVMRGKHLLASQTVALSASPGVARARWYDLDVSRTDLHPSPTLIQSGTIARGGLATYFPCIEIAPNFDIGLTFMESGSSEYMSMYVTGKDSTEAADGTMQIARLVRGGITTYSSFLEAPPLRAGDFSGICIDPTTRDFWACNEYATNNNFASQSINNWGTYITRFAITAPVTATITNGTDRLRSLFASGPSVSGTSLESAEKTLEELIGSMV